MFIVPHPLLGFARAFLRLSALAIISFRGLPDGLEARKSGFPVERITGASLHPGGVRLPGRDYWQIVPHYREKEKAL